jgi:predicted  nucleic acid-binding Zn-ribbon protein
LSLIEALSSAKREIDTQGTRVKELETLLLQEQAARKLAEERADQLEMRSTLVNGEAPVQNGIVPHPEDIEEKQQQDVSVETVQVNGIHPPETATDDSEALASAEANANKLQSHLDTMMEEMEEMRKQVASFKERAEKAEDETTQSRASLAEMVEKLRQEREKASSLTAMNKPDTTHETSNVQSGELASSEDATQSKSKSPIQHFDSVTQQNKELNAAATAFATHHRNNVLEEASPYASIFGVVLLGVGLMAYLNGWQKMDK